jgi:hypothetical protein
MYDALTDKGKMCTITQDCEVIQRCNPYATFSPRQWHSSNPNQPTDNQQSRNRDFIH